MISTVFRNLIANAIKYNSPGCEIIISSCPENGYIRFCIADDGKGITDPRVVALLSDDEQNDKKSPGYKRKGLGLILCKDFVVRNGGKIWLESEPDQGSRFFFTVPLALG
jgi:two-component system sensor histidine kinase/response regulator